MNYNSPFFPSKHVAFWISLGGESPRWEEHWQGLVSVKIRDSEMPKHGLVMCGLYGYWQYGWLFDGWTTNKTPEFWICAFEYLRCAVWPSNFWSWYKRSISSAGACQMVASVHCFLQAASSDSLGTQLFWGRSLRASAVENLDVWPLKIGFDLHEATSIC